MNLLALDSAGDMLAAALRTGGQTAVFQLDAGKQHSERMMVLVESLCAQLGKRPDEIEAVCCMQGPGSFTGLRIALSTAKGLSLALGIPLYAVPTLDCPAWAWRSSPFLVLPALDARKHHFYGAIYRQAQRCGDWQDADPEALAHAVRAELARLPAPGLVLTGQDAELLFPLLSPLLPGIPVLLDANSRRSYAKELLEIAGMQYTENKKGASADCGLLYLRKSSAELDLMPADSGKN